MPTIPKIEPNLTLLTEFKRLSSFVVWMEAVSRSMIRVWTPFAIKFSERIYSL